MKGKEIADPGEGKKAKAPGWPKRGGEWPEKSPFWDLKRGKKRVELSSLTLQ